MHHGPCQIGAMSLASTQYCGSGERAGFAFAPAASAPGCAARFRFAALTRTSAARWSNICTILPSYRGQATRAPAPSAFSQRLKAARVQPCRSSSSFFRNRCESFVMSNMRWYLTGHALSSGCRPKDLLSAPCLTSTGGRAERPRGVAASRGLGEVGGGLGVVGGGGGGGGVGVGGGKVGGGESQDAARLVELGQAVQIKRAAAGLGLRWLGRRQARGFAEHQRAEFESAIHIGKEEPAVFKVEQRVQSAGGAQVAEELCGPFVGGPAARGEPGQPTLRGGRGLGGGGGGGRRGVGGGGGWVAGRRPALGRWPGRVRWLASSFATAGIFCFAARQSAVCGRRHGPGRRCADHARQTTPPLAA